MGKRGPAPKPTALRVLHGDRADRINHDEPMPSDLPVQPPDWLDGDGLAVWHRLAPDLIRLRVLTHLDVDTFAAYCMATVRHEEAQAEIDRDGLTITGSEGGTIKHPACQVARDNATLMLTLGRHFGLTPSSRSELTGPSGRKRSTPERLLS